MKRYFIKITAILSIIFCNFINIKADEKLFSQYVITPTSTDLGKIADVPVSYYTGQASVSVPIFNTKQLNQSFSIDLTYDCSGILVNKLPGWTGHGWNLNAGGVISRVENDQVDEMNDLAVSNKNGFFHTYQILTHYVDSAIARGKNPTCYDNPIDCPDFWLGDKQPDIFYFNFCGMHGRFFLGNDGEWKVSSDYNITVEFDITDNTNYIYPFIEKFPATNTYQPKTIKGFTLIDEYGTRYTFGGTPNAIDYSIPIAGIGFSNGPLRYSWHANSWYLTSVTDRNGNELYTLEYERGYFVTHASYHFSDTNSWGNSHGPFGIFSGISFNNDDFKHYSFSISAPVYLSRISILDGTEVSFKSSAAFSTSRPAYKSLYDHYYQNYNNNQSGFNSSFFYNRYSSMIGVEDNSYKRYYYLTNFNNEGAAYRYPGYTSYDPFSATGLKCLDSIIVKVNGVPTNKYSIIYNEKAPRMHIMEIKMSDGFGGNVSSYNFTYNKYNNIPKDYLTTESDEWGYYIDKDSVWVSIHLRDSIVIDNGIKHIIPINDNHWEFFINKNGKSGTLSEISYPLGGKSVFEYERNIYSKYQNLYRNGMVSKHDTCGGFRIKSITTYDSGNSVNYSSRREFRYVQEDGKSSGELASLPIHFYEWHPTNQNNSSMTVYYMSLNSVIPLQTSFGNHIGYSRVVEIKDGVETIYEYSNFSDSPKDKSYLYRYQESITPADKYGEVGYRRGKIKSITQKDRNGRNLVKKTYNYRTDDIESKYVIACDVMQNTIPTSGNSTQFTYNTGGYYQLFYQRYDVVSITEKLYDDSGFNYVENKTLFTKGDYNGMRFDTAIEKKWNTAVSNKSITELTQYEYAFQLRQPDTVAFKNLNFYPIIRTKKFYNNQFADSVYTRYELRDGKLLPAYQLSKGDTIIKYISYNEKGLPTRIKQFGRPVSCLYWDNEKIQAIVTTDNNGSVSFDKNRDALNTIRINGVSAFSCANTEAVVAKYNNLNQISSITGSSGITKYYRYDTMGRLCSVSDHNGLVLDSISYHIQEHGSNYVRSQMFPSFNYGITYQYYDGLGRPTLQSTNAYNPNGNYVYSMKEYDSLGRESKKWNPVPDSHISEEKNILDFSNLSSSFYNDSYGYTQIEYDDLNRIIKTTRPGNLWHQNNVNSTNGYGFNRINEVKKYNISESNDSLSYVYYERGDLVKEITISEDGKKSVVFKNNLGDVVLERTINGNENIDTYYVYDQKRRLIWVLQPMYQSDPSINKYAFKYSYNDKDLLVSKQNPGCSPIQHWYNAANNLVKLQDGTLAKVGKFRTYTYDSLGRVLCQSICNSNGTKQYDEVVNYYDTDVSIDRVTKQLSLSNSCTNGQGNLSATKMWTSNGEYLLCTFSYDEYGRMIKKEELGLNNHLTETSITYSVIGEIVSENTKEYDYKNGAFVKALETTSDNTYIVSTNLPESSVLRINQGEDDNVLRADTLIVYNYTYDNLGHVISNNRSGLSGDIIYEYDNLHGWQTAIKSNSGFEQKMYRESDSAKPRFDGSVSAMVWKTENSESGHRYDYYYDKMNRLVCANYSPYIFDTCNNISSQNLISGNSEETLNQNGDELASSISGLLSSLIPVSDSPLGSPTKPADPPIDTTTHKPFIPADSLIWVDIPEEGDDEYTIDLPDAGNYDEFITYNRNSSITALKRYGMLNTRGYGLIDDLTIEYNGNQRTKVDDAILSSLNYNDAYDFHDRNRLSDDYAYNENGSLTKDLNRKIQNIEYDLLGNPRRVSSTTFSFSGSEERIIEYVYAADGRRLRTSHKKLNITLSDTQCLLNDSTDYIGNLILKNSKPEMYRFPGGYYDFNDDGSLNDSHYYIADYLGNNRMVINGRTGTVEQETHYYPYGGLIAGISTGQDKQGFKFGDKELDRTFGLDLYDFNARQYDAVVPWFTSTDPLSDKYYSISPYVYCAGDPVNLIDPTGCSTQVVEIDSTHYEVVGGDFDDGDNNIYVVTGSKEKGYKRTGKILGQTPTPTSFNKPKLMDDTCKVLINTEDMSGIDFISEIINNTPFLLWYAWNARNIHKYDFKATNGTDKEVYSQDYYYRGMPFIGKDGVKMYASARDIGNIAAGIVAKKRGLSWKVARFGFDSYQTYSNLHIINKIILNAWPVSLPGIMISNWEKECITTQNAQLYGYKMY